MKRTIACNNHAITVHWKNDPKKVEVPKCPVCHKEVRQTTVPQEVPILNLLGEQNEVVINGLM